MHQQTSVEYLEDVSRNSTNSLVRAKAHNALNEWTRFLEARKQQKLANRALWDLLAGAEQKGKKIRWSNDQDQTITFATGGMTFTFPIFAEAQDRRGRARTPGAFVTGIAPKSHRVPQEKKWGPTLRSYP